MAGAHLKAEVKVRMVFQEVKTEGEGQWRVVLKRLKEW